MKVWVRQFAQLTAVYWIGYLLAVFGALVIMHAPLRSVAFLRNYFGYFKFYLVPATIIFLILVGGELLMAKRGSKKK